MNFLSFKIKQFLSFLLKIFVVVVAFYFVQSQLNQKEWSWDIVWKQWQKPMAIWYFVVLLLLTFFNRFLEILKWKNLAQVVEPITIWESTKQVLIGITFGIVTPNGLGEYAGKAWFFAKKDAIKIIFLNAVCNGVQVMYAIGFGVLGLVYINSMHYFFSWYYLYVFFGVLVLAIFVILGLKNISIKGYSLQIIFGYLKQIRKSIHLKNIFLALLRYTVLIHQYYFLYRFFDVDIQYFSLLAVVASIYLLASSLPNFQAIDFALKGSVAIYLLGFFGVNEWVVALVATSIWLLNLVIPISIGAVFLLIFNPKRRGFSNSNQIR